MTFDPNEHTTQHVVESRMRRSSRIGLRSPIVLAIVIALGFILWVGSGLLSQGSTGQQTAKPINQSRSEIEPFKVVVRTLTTETYGRHITLQAVTEADKIVTIAAETMGTIAKTPVAKGAFVQKGQVICEIDKGAREAQLSEARALRDARKIDFQAARRLNKQGHMSKSKLAASRAAYDSAVAAVEARLVELQRTQIKAPFDGILDRLPVRLGDYISPGQPCGTVIDKDPLLVVAHLAENRIKQISVGDAGEAHLATGETINGFIRYIAESPNPATRTYRVEMEVPNKDLALRDGVTGDLVLSTADILATRVSQSVLSLERGVLGVRVFENDAVVFRPVTIVGDKDGDVFITGLQASEQVIVFGGEFTRDGRPVKFVFEDAGLVEMTGSAAER